MIPAPENPPARVRVATEADEDALYELLKGLEEDNGLGWPHDEERVRHHIELGTRRRGGIHGVIDDPANKTDAIKLVGSVGVIFNQPWYAKDWFWHELWLFVLPQHRRGTGYADDLRQWMRWYQHAFEKANGARVPFFTSVTSRKRLDAKIRWWRRWGTQVGAIFELK